jgi:hypothetical protein
LRIGHFWCAFCGAKRGEARGKRGEFCGVCVVDFGGRKAGQVFKKYF